MKGEEGSSKKQKVKEEDKMWGRKNGKGSMLFCCGYLRVTIIPRDEGKTCEQRVWLCEHPLLVQLVFGRGADCIVGRGQPGEDLYKF